MAELTDPRGRAFRGQGLTVYYETRLRPGVQAHGLELGINWGQRVLDDVPDEGLVTHARGATIGGR